MQWHGLPEELRYMAEFLVTIPIDATLYYPVPNLLQLEVSMVCTDQVLMNYLAEKQSAVHETQ
jgi:hypothetical protein